MLVVMVSLSYGAGQYGASMTRAAVPGSADRA